MSTQSHIHLAIVGTVSGAPENAPTYKWAVRAESYFERSEFQVSINRGPTGKLIYGFMGTGSVPTEFRNYSLRLIVEERDSRTVLQNLQLMRDMNRRICNFVPPEHPADAADHTAYLRQVLVEFDEVVPFDVAMTRYEIDVRLTDATTLAT
jgi:hypothetical protein